MLNEKLICIMRRLEECGYEAYAVGGCVRDAFLGKSPMDFDVATNALPSETKAVFADFKTIDTGIKHGTVTVMAYGCTAEVTTYRTDGSYTDCRHPDSVRFSKTIDEDLKRRDFTINAIACNADGKVVDLFGGMDDIKSGVIRCVGNPETRFGEDALRILRTLRFAATLGFCVEKKTAKAVHECAALIDAVSAERIYSEIKKLVCGNWAPQVINEFSDVFLQIFPCLFQNLDMSLKIFENTSGGFCLKFAALMHPCGSQATRGALRRLKADNKTVKRVCSALDVNLCEIPMRKSDILRALHRFGGEALCDAAYLWAAYCTAVGDACGAKRWTEFAENAQKLRESDCYMISQLAVNGDDVMKFFGLSGSNIGKKLERLLFDVMDGKVANERSELLKKRE